MFRACAVVPSRNHYCAMAEIVSRLSASGLHVFVIDDGSDEPARSTLARLHEPDRGVDVIRLEENRGKGAAVCHGFGLAYARGFTHAVQVDADGQHDLAALPGMLDLAKRHPSALVSGRPAYDRTAPRARRIGRWLTHVWVWIETLSLRIPDSMCGFRVYPLPQVIDLLAEETVGRRMDFDTDIMVRLFWRNVPVAMVPVRVSYPAGNTSNFEMLADNWRITRMHTRLVLTMLTRLRSILRNRPEVIAESRHWASLSERGLMWGLRFSAAVHRNLGRRVCLAILSPVVVYFYLTGARQRSASREFLARAFAANGIARRPGWLDGCRHFMSFAGRALDTLAAWSGDLPRDIVFDDEASVIAQAAADPRGALFIVSHVGNTDLARALLDPETRNRLTVLVHTHHAVNYNKVLEEFSPEAAVNSVQVTEINPETAIELKDRIGRGEWIVIAGDRSPVNSQGRVFRAPFLGHDAAFPMGPFVLAALMDCPVYTLFCLREGKRYRFYSEKFADRIELPRSEREARLNECVARYARRLEYIVGKDPYQWYNFFDFWA